MRTNVRVSADELCTVNLTGNNNSLGYQCWGSPHDDSIIMYLTADQAEQIAAHFASLAGQITALEDAAQAPLDVMPMTVSVRV